MSNITVDLSALASGLLIAVGAAMIIGLFKLVKTVNHLVYLVGSTNPPDGLLGRMGLLEENVKSLRDWSLVNGFERRNNNRKFDQ